MDNYFDGPGASKPPMEKKPMMAKPAPSDNDGDEQGGSIQIHESQGGASFEFDGQQYSSPSELCDALEAKYGGKQEAKPAQDKPGGYLSKVVGE